MPDDAPKESARIKVLARVVLKKFAGDSQDGEPLEVIESKDEGFDEALAKLTERKSHAPD